MKHIDNWCHIEKTPIPQSKVLELLIEDGKKKDAIINALRGLVKLGYIRRAVTSYFDDDKLKSDNNRTYYVMLRKI